MQIRRVGSSPLWVVLFSVGALLTSSCSRQETPSTAPVAGPFLSNPTGGEIVGILAPGQNVDDVIEENGLVELGYLPDSGTLLFEAPAGFDPNDFDSFGPNDEFVYTEHGNGFISFYEGTGDVGELADPSDTWGQTALADMDLGTVHETAWGHHAKIAVLDTGVDLDHPQLAANLIVVDDTELGRPDLDGVEGPLDEAYRHGTHVCGVILCVAPGAQIYPFRVLGENGRGTPFDLLAGADAAIAAGVDIVNMSLTINVESLMARKAIDRLSAAGIVVVAAGGNNTVGFAAAYPASDPNVHGVAATGAVLVVGEPLDYSTIAPFSARDSQQLAFAAPGVDVAGALPEEITTPFANPFSFGSGTSTACAVVTGCMAVMLGSKTQLIPGDLVRVLETNTEPVFPSNVVSFGLASPAKALTSGSGGGSPPLK